MLFDFYSDTATLWKSNTHGATFVRIRFSNIQTFFEQWFTVGTASNTSYIPLYLPDERRMYVKIQLFHRFIFLLFNPMIRASFNGYRIDGQTYFTRLDLVLADQPEESTLLCLKSRDSDMDCSHCVLPSRLRSTTNVPSRPRDSSSSEEDSVLQHRRRTSMRHTAGQLCHNRHSERDPSVTMRHQLSLSLHQRDRMLCTVQLAQSRPHIISFSAHDLPRLSLPSQV